jgi:hypothetical protein
MHCIEMEVEVEAGVELGLRWADRQTLRTTGVPG